MLSRHSGRLLRNHFIFPNNARPLQHIVNVQHFWSPILHVLMMKRIDLCFRNLVRKIAAFGTVLNESNCDLEWCVFNDTLTTMRIAPFAVMLKIPLCVDILQLQWNRHVKLYLLRGLQKVLKNEELERISQQTITILKHNDAEFRICFCCVVIC